MPAVKDLTRNMTFRHIKEPVALYFSYVDADMYDFYERNRIELIRMRSSCKHQLVSHLLKRRYNIVSDDDPRAADPAKIVVSDTGIQTPFLEPKGIRNAARSLLHDVNDSNFARVRSYIFAIRLSQLPLPVAENSPITQPFKYLRHPDAHMIREIEYKYGRNFIDQMVNQAWRNGEETAPLLHQEYDINDMSQPLYAGRGLAVDPFYCFAREDMESRYVIFATADYADAARYSYKEERRFGLVHMYKKDADQPFYSDYSIELGLGAARSRKNQIETQVVPGINDYLGLEMFMGDRHYVIPRQEDKWQVFLEYYRGGYMPRKDKIYMHARRQEIINEAKNNQGKAVTHLLLSIDVAEMIKESQREHLSQSLEQMTAKVKAARNATPRQAAPARSDNLPENKIINR